jgi:hypothetical protein
MLLFIVDSILGILEINNYDVVLMKIGGKVTIWQALT